MPLDAGFRLGPYEILTPLGAGGMGEVYRAKDTRLDRFVAIKVLPHGRTAGPALERFQREARAASALNHPNICTIFDVGVEPAFIAMELLEGETLQQRLIRDPLDIRSLVETIGAMNGLRYGLTEELIMRRRPPDGRSSYRSSQVRGAQDVALKRIFGKRRDATCSVAGIDRALTRYRGAHP